MIGFSHISMIKTMPNKNMYFAKMLHFGAKFRQSIHNAVTFNSAVSKINKALKKNHLWKIENKMSKKYKNVDY